MSEPEYQDLTQVFQGEVHEATLLRSALEAEGFETFIQDENIKVVDPFVTGASPLQAKLLARTEEGAEVAAAIEELKSGEHALDDEAEVGETEEGPAQHSRKVSVSTLWWILIAVLLMPLVLTLGPCS
jgi:hypothetical protein